MDSLNEVVFVTNASANQLRAFDVSNPSNMSEISVLANSNLSAGNLALGTY